MIFPINRRKTESASPLIGIIFYYLINILTMLEVACYKLKATRIRLTIPSPSF